MIIQNQVGPIAAATSIAPGTQVVGRAGQMGDGIVSEFAPRYYEATYRQQKFNGANTAATATTAGLATTYTGLVLYNPAGNTRNLIVTKVGYSFIVAPAAAMAIGLMTGYAAAGIVTASAAGNPGSTSLIGTGSAPTGKAALSATLVGTPLVHSVFGMAGTAAATAMPTITGSIVDLEGGVVLPPGGYAAIYTSTASGAASFLGSIEWLELPL